MAGPVLVEYAVELLDATGATVGETIATFVLVDERRLTLEPLGGAVALAVAHPALDAATIVVRCLPEYGGREIGRVPVRRVR